MDEMGFMTLYDPWTEGLQVDVWEKGLSEQQRLEETCKLREAALREVRYHPLMEAWCARAYAALGQQEHAKNHFDKAVRGMRAFANIEPWDNGLQSLRATNNVALARLLRETADINGARRAYREALWLSPWLPVALYELFTLEREQANVGKAAQCLAAYVNHVSTPLPWSYSILGGLYEQTGQVEDAFRAYKSQYKQIEYTDPNAVYWWVHGAVLLGNTGQVERAVNELSAARDAHPEFGLTYMYLAQMLTYLHRFDEARAVVDAGLRINPADPNLSTLRAKIGPGAPAPTSGPP